MVQKWKTLASKKLADYRIFSVRQDRRRSPRTGRDHDFFILDSQDWINVIPLTPNPAFLNNQCHTYLALNARWVQPPQFDGAEDIAVEEIDLDKVAGLIENGRITHALVVAAFYHLDRRPTRYLNESSGH